MKVQLKVYVNKNTRAKLRRVAKETKQTMSALVEDLIIKFKGKRKVVK